MKDRSSILYSLWQAKVDKTINILYLRKRIFRFVDLMAGSQPKKLSHTNQKTLQIAYAYACVFAYIRDYRISNVLRCHSRGLSLANTRICHLQSFLVRVGQFLGLPSDPQTEKYIFARIRN